MEHKANEDDATFQGGKNEPKKIKVSFAVRAVVRAPCCICWLMFLTVIALTIIVLAVVSRGASGFLDVFAIPWFTPRDTLQTKRNLAYNVALDNKYVVGGDVEEPDEREREFTLYPISLTYEDIAGNNLLTKANIEKIALVEKSIQAIRWDKVCLLSYKDADQKADTAKCAPPTTVLNYLYKNDSQHQRGCEDGYCIMPKASVNLCNGSYTGYSWGNFPCRTTIFDWRQAVLADESEWAALLSKQLCAVGIENKFLLDRAGYDCDGKDVVKSKYLRSRFTIGYPLEGFKDRDDRESTQANALVGGIFGRGSYGPALLKSMRDTIDPLSATAVAATAFTNTTRGGKSINVFFSEGVTGREADAQFSGIFLSVLSIIFVFLYIWLNVGSLFLAATGMFEIVASLPLAWFFWRIIMQQKLIDVFMLSLVIFLILCIGADDIFVFMDLWKSSRAKPLHISGSLETRLQWTFEQASSAMFTTTATTVLALLASCVPSSIPFIQGFGIFALLVVCFDYLLVISWFPVTVIVYTTYFEKQWPWCCACLPSCKPLKGEVGVSEAERPTVRVIRQTIVPAFQRYRWPLFLSSSALIIAMAAYLGVSYKVSGDFPDFYVARHPFNAYNRLGRTKFFEATDWKHQILQMYGYNETNAVNRSLGNQLTQDITKDEDVVGNYNSFDFTPDLQNALVQDCRDLQTNATLVKDIEVYCILKDLQDFDKSRFPYQNEKELRKALDQYYLTPAYAIRARAFPRYAIRTGYVPDGEFGIKAMWNTYNVTIPKEISSSPEELGPYFTLWEAQRKDCAASCYFQLINPPISRPVTFQFMDIIAILEANVWTTVGWSLLCAWAVLVVVTRNWYISTMVAIVIMGIMTCVISSVFTIGYELDIFVSTFVALVIGLAVDYSVHIAHFYVHSDGTRYERAQHSLQEILVSVVGGAITSIFAGLPLFAAPSATNSLFGFFIFFTALWSILLTLTFFVPALFIFGPEGGIGTFSYGTRLLPHRKTEGGVRDSKNAKMDA